MWKMLGLLTGGMAAGLLLRSEYEKRHFVTEEITIASDKIKADRRVVFLSDLHNKEFGHKNRELLEAIERIRPDVVLIGGDTIVSRPDRRTDLSVTINLIQALAKRYPVYYANGNHEQRLAWDPDVYGSSYKELRKELKKAGVCHLSDKTVSLGEDIRVSGLNIDRIYYRKFKYPQLKKSYIDQHLGRPDSSRYQILLAHSPMFFAAYSDWGADLSLAGHVHGGTIRLPLLGGVMTPQFQFFVPWCAGFFERSGKHLLVSRGLGTHSINIRLNDKPQVLVVNLKSKTTF